MIEELPDYTVVMAYYLDRRGGTAADLLVKEKGCWVPAGEECYSFGSDSELLERYEAVVVRARPVEPESLKGGERHG